MNELWGYKALIANKNKSFLTYDTTMISKTGETRQINFQTINQHWRVCSKNPPFARVHFAKAAVTWHLEHLSINFNFDFILNLYWESFVVWESSINQNRPDIMKKVAPETLSAFLKSDSLSRDKPAVLNQLFGSISEVCIHLFHFHWTICGDHFFTTVDVLLWK